MLSTQFKVGLVTIFSCLALLLGLFASTGVASAHSYQAAHTQTSQVSASTEDQQWCRREWVQDWGWGEDNWEGYGWYGHNREGYGWGGRWHPRGHWEWRCHHNNWWEGGEGD